MVTAVTSHAYPSAEESPYIVQVRMIGKGEAGIVEGSDKIIVTVTELPVILVSAGESITVEGGTEAEFRGSFNRPAGVTNLRYSWSFGDGTAPVEGDIGDSNIVEASHNYVHLRQQPYVATLTVTGDSEAGPVEASSSVNVYVIEGEGWVVGGYGIGRYHEGRCEVAVSSRQRPYDYDHLDCRVQPLLGWRTRLTGGSRSLRKGPQS